MNNSIFLPIAERDLIHVAADGRETQIHIAIGSPYFPAKLEAMKSYAGCLVLTCDDPDLTTELHGVDEMEALIAGLEFLELFLRNLVAISGGALKTENGLPFDPAGSPLLKESRGFLVKKRDH